MKNSKDKKQNTVPDWLLKSRDKWNYTGQQRPPFAETPKAGQVSVWDFPRPPALEKVSETIQVYHNGIAIATSKNAFAMQETASPPTYYIPPEDVHQPMLIAMSGKKSLCEWKGQAAYWALVDHPDEPVAWSYAQPFEPYQDLVGYFAFYPQHLDCFLDGEKATPQPGQFYAGWITSAVSGPFKGEPGTGHW